MTFENTDDEMEARITAYAFGELEGEELAAMEAAVAADPRLALRVAELRAFGGELGAALVNESALAEPVPEPVSETVPEARVRVLRFPSWAWAAVGFAAAAGLAVAIWLPEGGVPADNPGLVKIEMPPSPAEAVERPVVIAAPAEDGEKAASETMAATQDLSNPPVVAASELPAPPVVVPEPAPAPVLAPDAPALAAVAVPPVPAAAPAVDPGVRLRAMLDKGRSQYAAGDLDGAVASFEAARKIDARNREAGYFSARIAQERARAGKGVSKPAPTGRSSGPTMTYSHVSSGSPGAIVESRFVSTRAYPVSTFSADVDTAGYSVLRREIQKTPRNGSLPPEMRVMRRPTAEVRIEELINYFPYRYAPPLAQGIGSEEPFAGHLAVATAPWAPGHRLVRVGIKAADLAYGGRPAANLVFVVDISNSMVWPQCLPLVRVALLQLIEGLRPDDRVAIITFGTKAELYLPSTPVERTATIQEAIRRLRPNGGSTDGGSGIGLGYETAREHFQPAGINRVILCTDGLFNVGVTGREELLELIREKARGRVFLTVLGFGPHLRAMHGNPTPVHLAGHLEQLADNGNGAYHFLDSPREARKILVDEVEGMLATIAKDVKIQVEFNPERVSSYRLIGYENRALGEEDFNDGKVDAGEIGAGHTITALYQIEPAKNRPRKRVSAKSSVVRAEDRLLTVKIRYKEPLGEAEESRMLEFALADEELDFEDADEDFRFAASVAAWGMLLRGSPYSGSATFDDVRRWARECRSYDPGDYREEFLDLVRASRALYRR